MSTAPEQLQQLQQKEKQLAPRPNIQPQQNLQNSIQRAEMYNQQQARPSPMVQGPNLEAVTNNNMLQSMQDQTSQEGQNKNTAFIANMMGK